MISFYDGYVIAYYSCDRNLALRIIRGKERVRRSRNSSCWFGPGFYFWEDPFRALRDAIDRANNGEIKDPAVIGVVVEPGNCFILCHPVSLKIPPEDFLLIKRLLEKEYWGEKKPGGIPFDTVYCHVYNESGNDQAAELQGQICLFDPERIKGLFNPQPGELFNPDVR